MPRGGEGGVTSVRSRKDVLWPRGPSGAPATRFVYGDLGCYGVNGDMDGGELVQVKEAVVVLRGQSRCSRG